MKQKFRLRVTTLHGERFEVEPTEHDWSVAAVRIANEDGAWNRSTMTYYPARSIASVQVLEAPKDPSKSPGEGEVGHRGWDEITEFAG